MAFTNLKSNNPFFNEDKMNRSTTLDGQFIDQTQVMTMEGAINKSLVLFGILLLTSVISYMMPSMFMMIVGALGGLAMVIWASFKPSSSAISAPVYAAFEGLFLGTVSAVYAASTKGIVTTAVMLTFATLGSMLLLYKYQIIKVTEKLRAGLFIATASIALVYLVAFVFRLFGYDVPYIHSGGAIGIGFSVVVIGIAALNLLLDFDNFDTAAENRSPKYMEWFCAMGLMITLVWLYVEFLRLLSKLNRD